MAHSCPECSICYCGGDIDDCLLDDEDAIATCKHYLKPECAGFEDDYDYEDEEPL